MNYAHNWAILSSWALVYRNLQKQYTVYFLQDFEGAAEMFQKASACTCATLAQQQAAWSNLAACKLALSRYEDVISASNAALQLLLSCHQGDRWTPTPDGDVCLPAEGILEQCKALRPDPHKLKALAKVLARRGSANALFRRSVLATWYSLQLRMLDNACMVGAHPGEEQHK